MDTTKMPRGGLRKLEAEEAEEFKNKLF